MQRLLLLLPVLLVASCDCQRYTKNIVADGETHKVLHGVQVLSVGAINGKQVQERYIYTDSSGRFEAGFTENGTAKCPILKLTLRDSNYADLRVVEPRLGDTLFMKRLN